jgi:hypothetical protein
LGESDAASAGDCTTRTAAKAMIFTLIEGVPGMREINGVSSFF